MSDWLNQRIRRVDAVTGFIETTAGDGTAGLTGDGGPASLAHVKRPTQLLVDPSGRLLIADTDNDRLRVIAPEPPPSGAVPDEDAARGDGLVVAPSAGGILVLSWGRSCRLDDSDYEVYEGDLRDLYSHAPILCSTGGARSVTVTPWPGDTYFLVVPRNAVGEGSYGLSSDGAPRPAGATACLPRAPGIACR